MLPVESIKKLFIIYNIYYESCMNVKNIGHKREISEYDAKLNYTNKLFGLKYLDITI